MELLPEIQSRSSIRSYAGTPLEQDVVERILEAGRCAPSAKNRQALRFVAIRDRTLREKLCEASFGQEYVAQAPFVVAVCTTNIEYRMPNGQLSYPIDAGIAASFMVLQAQHDDVGSCIVTTFQEDEIKALISVPYRMRVVMLITFGYPSETPEPSRRLPVDRVVGWDHW